MFQRALRGVYEGKIKGDDFWEVLPFEDDEDVRPVSTKPVEKDEDEVVREMLVKLKTMADKARIPDEPFEMNIAAEVKKLVDKALEGK